MNRAPADLSALSPRLVSLLLEAQDFPILGSYFITNTAMSHYEGDTQSSAERDQEQDQYLLAARFATERTAQEAYQQAQETIFAPVCDVSVYRFLLGTDCYVAVLGTRPPTEVAQSLQTILAAGEAMTLPEDVYQALRARRVEAAREGTWVERHFQRGSEPRRPRS